MIPIWIEIVVDREADPPTVTFSGKQIVPGIGHTGTDEGTYDIDEELNTNFDTDLDSWFPENTGA